MSNSYRIRTQVGVDKYINVELEQDFESLEILSLKILQSQIYTRQCSDYGVVIGRISVNDGYGIPNAKVSVFIPLSEEDNSNQVISELYPYKSVSDINDDGYRYNLLPYTSSHGGHNPTGTFPTREDVLIETNLIEVFDKYYKYTSKTNDSGDFMIFGVPIGEQTIHIDIDLSDIGEFSLSPQDLIRMGVASESQVNGAQFRTSTNLSELPQIISINRIVEVEPLWGQPEICNLGITRTDIDLSSEANITLQPTAIFMGSVFSNNDAQAVKRGCRPPLKGGEMCNLTAGPGEILAIRQTIQQDTLGRPILELYELENSGKVIDDNGAWLIDVPMNLDYIYTNEFGERTISNDPKIGVPTKAKYRFKVKWEQPPTLRESVKRANFLVPNIKEWGWDSGDGLDPLTNYTNTDSTICYNPFFNPTSPDPMAVASYAFSLTWEDYGETIGGILTANGLQMVQEAIDCDDRFYEMYYNKVYSVSQLITEYRKGKGKRRMTVVKNILDDVCESTNNKFPSNDAQFRPNIVYMLAMLLLQIMFPVMVTIVILAHIVKLVTFILYLIVGFVKLLVCFLKDIFCTMAGVSIAGFHPLGFVQPLCNFLTKPCNVLQEAVDALKDAADFKIRLPNLVYSGPGDCELCECKIENLSGQTSSLTQNEDIATGLSDFVNSQGLNSFLTKFQDYSQYTCPEINEKPNYAQLFAGQGITDPPSYQTNAPQLLQVDNQNPNSDRLFTSSLTFPERLNLFNTKAKYFDENTVGGGTNPGGGVNRIKVTFQSDLNDPNQLFHYDNIIMMLVDNNNTTDFSIGNMISFNSLESSGDPNLNLLDDFNEYGNYAITGTTVPSGPINVSYANFDGSGNNTVTYNYNPNPVEDQLFAKFAIDMEYFQVIESTTIGQYLSQSNTSLPNSLVTRFIDNPIKFLKISNSPPSNTQSLNDIPYDCFSEFANQKLIFLVRGVDPYSTRVPCQYDLSYIYGYNSWGNKVITGNFKLNIPIQGSFKCVKHDSPLVLTDSSNIDTYSNTYLFYDSYGFQPGNQFQPFITNVPSFYSDLDSSIGLNPIPNMTNIDTLTGIRVDTQNFFTQEFNCPNGNSQYVGVSNDPTNGQNRGYFTDEPVEGGSLLSIQSISTTSPQPCSIPPPFLGPTILNFPPTAISEYYCKRYSDTMVMNIGLGTSGRQIVMRSDRLPISSGILDNLDMSYPMHTNTNFSVYIISDDGTIQDPVISPPPQVSTGDSLENQQDIGGILASLNPSNDLNSNLSKSFNCEGLAPLGCYKEQIVNGIATIVVPDRDINEDCWTNQNLLGNKKKFIMEGGCYVLLNFTMQSLLSDFKLVIEWIYRTKVNFALCQNVFAHLFTNSWINGSLFMFPFKNNRRFDNQTNAPYSCYCHHLIYLDTNTNSFYYRSSPYNQITGDFIGRRNPNSLLGFDFKGNDRNLMYPTTMIDLGPRNGYITELTFDDNYRGFFVDKLNTTSFGDVGELLNLFVMSRLSNSSFIGQILAVALGTPGTDPVRRFFSRTNAKVDGDYAQMVAINSQLGVVPYDENEYVTTDVYCNGANVNNNVFGVFYQSDQEIRDLFSPRREIITLGGAPSANCTFNYLPNFSQNVPFYQWEVLINSDGNSIFGSQKNDWYTLPVIGNSFLQYKYQLMDRIGGPSRFPQPIDQSQENYFKGYIFNVISNPSPPPPGVQSPTVGPTGIQTNGNPFHFYFGLNVGKSAYDRFLTKWVKTDIVEQ
jgi:hypothetical protein